MTATVNPRRYVSPRRTAAAAQTRAAIIDSARTCFLTDGYERTTLRAVSERAGVSVATVKAIFANKAGLVSALRDVALAGDAEEVPLVERADYLSMLATTDPVDKLRLFAASVAAIHARVGGIHRLVRDAAATDPTMAELWRLEHEQRRLGMEPVAVSMREDGAFRAGLDLQTAITTLWVLSSPETFWLLRDTSGMSPGAYTTWLHRAMVGAICAEGLPTRD